MGGEETLWEQATACLQEALPRAGRSQSRVSLGGWETQGKGMIWALGGREGNKLKGANQKERKRLRKRL